MKDTNICDTFAARLTKYRERRKWSQSDLARKLGCHRSYICNLEAGRQNPTITTVEQLANVLGVKVVNLLK